MSDSAAPKVNYMFVPQPLELVQVDKMALKLYPVIDLKMKPPEHAHAYQINKTALAAPGIDPRMMLDTLGALLNLSTIVDSVLGDWHPYFCRNWSRLASLTILLFHNNAGQQVNDMTTAANLAVLFASSRWASLQLLIGSRSSLFKSS